MNQIATVERIIDAETAEVTVVRQSACGHDCENCGGCGVSHAGITVRANCRFPVERGDRVELYSDNRVLGYAVLVYLVPVALFLAGYLLFPSLSEGIRYLLGGCGFALGIGAAVICDRAVRCRRAVTYEIIRKL